MSWRCSVRVSAVVGGRRGEVDALRWTDVDLVAGDLTITKALVESRDRTIDEKDTKTHQARRIALARRDASVALLIARGVSRFEWINNHSRPGRTWHAVTGSIPDSRGGRFSLLLGFASDAELRLEADGAEFYVGDMAGMDCAPPDFAEDDDETIQAGMPNWAWTFVPTAATFLDPMN